MTCGANVFCDIISDGSWLAAISCAFTPAAISDYRPTFVTISCTCNSTSSLQYGRYGKEIDLKIKNTVLENIWVFFRGRKQLFQTDHLANLFAA
jgi:hypothetical protein